MAKINYKSKLEITVKKKLLFGSYNFTFETLNIPVHSFEVAGGTNRKINLTSADEVSVALEFEQARTLNNLIFYMPPTSDFLAVKLLNLSNQKEKKFTFSFDVWVLSEKKLIRAYNLSSDSAGFLETPTPVGGTPPLLMVKVGMDSPELFYGKSGKKDGAIILKKI